jgi:hypothetical protein
LADIDYLDADHTAALVKIEHDAGADLFGLSDRRFVKTDVEGIGRLVHAHPHLVRLLLDAFRSKTP